MTWCAGAQQKHLKDQSEPRFLREGNYPQVNYGFDYHANFRANVNPPLWAWSLSSSLRKKVDQKISASMTATLSSLKTLRECGRAHTHLKGTTRILNAPSVTVGQFLSLSMMG